MRLILNAIRTLSSAQLSSAQLSSAQLSSAQLYTKKSRKRQEIFFNQVLAFDEIDRLLDPKALSNFSRYNQNGKQPVGTLKRHSDGTLAENLIIKGNNLVALHTLLATKFKERVKLIYIDPPYNTGNDSFKYNDKFNHSTWLTFMKNRLEIARELLADDGVIFVQCDDNEQAYLKVLMDEVFRRENFINIVTVKTKIGGVSGSSEGKSLRDATEFLLLSSKDKFKLQLNPVFQKTEISEYVEDYKSTGKSWKYTQVLVELGEKFLLEEQDDFKYYHYPNSKSVSIAKYCAENNLSENDVYNSISNKVYRTTNAQSSIRTKIIEDLKDIKDGIVSIEYTPKKGKNKGQVTEVFYNGFNKDMFMFLSDMLFFENKKFFYLQKINTLWEDIQYNNLNKEGDYIDFTNGKKPEQLIKRIIELATNENDIILDFHLGSGTTAAVAHKMNRQYIGIEQMDYIETLAVERLKKVIDGEQSGISKAANWQGGGEFVYFELAAFNEKAKDLILACEDFDSLKTLFNELCSRYFLKYTLSIKEFADIMQEAEFQALSLDEQKQMMLEMLDLNQLYVNVSDMEDSQFDDVLSDEDKNLTLQFYGEQ
ncbi:site-specific DNA-methyltransferase [Pasteurella langaaensis]|uniref:site-specific DNA-methyltransferase n=1 Tax=Alitibacter langaaensis TaxID=756 RepID=UPI000E3016C8|nr:site-specific DNA-methyltransferase [Pasteurella langaaensis]